MNTFRLTLNFIYQTGSNQPATSWVRVLTSVTIINSFLHLIYFRHSFPWQTIIQC